MSHIEDAMQEWMGNHCPEFEPRCACCQGWAEVDEIDRLRVELAEQQRRNAVLWEATAVRKADNLRLRTELAENDAEMSRMLAGKCCAACAAIARVRAVLDNPPTPSRMLIPILRHALNPEYAE